MNTSTDESLLQAGHQTIRKPSLLASQLQDQVSRLSRIYRRFDRSKSDAWSIALETSTIFMNRSDLDYSSSSQVR